MAKGDDDAKREVNLYYMSLLMGFCRGPVDQLLEIMAGDFKTVWKGDYSATLYSQIPINNKELFGGYEQEGGLIGWITAMYGLPTQLMLAPLCTKMLIGLTPATTEAYRGMFTLFMTGANYSGGMEMNANSKSLPTFYARLARFPKQLPQDVAKIPCPVDRTSDDVQNLFKNSKIPWLANLQAYIPKVINPKTGQVETIVIEYQNDANPSHVIYDMLVRCVGVNPALIETNSFIDVANKCFIGEIINEGQPDRVQLGISYFWSQQSKVFDEINKILNLISATLYPDPNTGKLTIKLIRDDYNLDDPNILELDSSNSTITTYQRAGLGEIVNAIKVTYTNPKNAKEETVVAMNSASIATQGGIVQDTRDYAGCNNPDLAGYLALRELKLAQATETCEVKCFGVAWDQIPGGVVKLSSDNPDYGFVKRPFRITGVDYGSSKTNEVVLQLANDVFADPGTGYLDPYHGSQMQPIYEYPKPAAAQIAFTTPAFFVTRAAQLAQLDPSITFTIVLAAQVGIYTIDYELLIDNGNGYNSYGRYLMAACGYLGQQIEAEAQTLMPTFAGTIGEASGAGGYLLIGEDENTQEICRVESVSAQGYVLSRGMFDTVPRARRTNDRVWFFRANSDTFDRTQRPVGSNVAYKILPRTSADTLDPIYAPSIATPATERPHQPNRPANCALGGVSFQRVTIMPQDADTHLTATWANRNRILEDTTGLLWTDGDMQPEAGQTTMLLIVDRDSGNEVGRHEGLTGTSFDIPMSDFGDGGRFEVRFYAKRDGIDSLQYFGIQVDVVQPGWGKAWNHNWGSPQS